MCALSFVQNFSFLGLLIQDNLFAYAFHGTSGLAMSLMIMMCVFYVVAIYFAFHAYREFKGMMHDNGMGGQSMMGIPSMS